MLFGLTGYNSIALVYALVGVVFVTTMGVIAYHFHIAYTAKLELWLKIKAKLVLLIRCPPIHWIIQPLQLAKGNETGSTN